MSSQPMDVAQAEARGQATAAAAVAAPSPTAIADEYITVPLTAIVPSPLNPRKYFDDVAIDELAASIRSVGVLEPLLVRPNRNAGRGRMDPRFEIVAGERRFRASKVAGLEAVPVRVKHLTDPEALEIMVIENLQRKDLGALEEAEGYRQLQEQGHTVDDLARKVGKSKAYIYARLKLDALIPEVKALVSAETLTPGHAILLARLTPADQKRAISKQHDSGIYESHYDNGKEQLDVVSVRALDEWIERNVRLDPAAVVAAPEGDVPPETVAALASAKAKAQPVILITREYHLYGGHGQKGAPHIVLAHDWKGAAGDAKAKWKPCDNTVTGFVAIGRGRGDTFPVCVEKKCKTHWPPAPKLGGTYTPPARSKAEIERDKKAKEERSRWSQALPAIVDAAAAKIRKTPARADSPLGKMLLDRATDGELYIDRQSMAEASKVMPRGKTADDLVRHLAFALIFADAKEEHSREDLKDALKDLGLDVKPLLAAAPEKEAAPKKAKRG